MKALPEHQKALLVVQSHDNRVAQLAHTRDSIPERHSLTAVLAQLREISQVLVARNGVLEDAKLELSRLEDDVKVVDERLPLVFHERRSSLGVRAQFSRNAQEQLGRI